MFEPVKIVKIEPVVLDSIIQKVDPFVAFNFKFLSFSFIYIEE